MAIRILSKYLLLFVRSLGRAPKYNVRIVWDILEPNICSIFSDIFIVSLHTELKFIPKLTQVCADTQHSKSRGTADIFLIFIPKLHD